MDEWIKTRISFTKLCPKSDKAQRIFVYSSCIALLHRLPLDKLQHLLSERNSLFLSSIVGNVSASHLFQPPLPLEFLHQLGQSAPEIVGQKLCPRQVDDETTCSTKG